MQGSEYKPTIGGIEIDDDQDIQRQSVVFRNAAPTEEINKLLGTQFVQLSAESSNFERIFEAFRILEYNPNLLMNDSRGYNLVREVSYLSLMLENVQIKQNEEGNKTYQVNVMYFNGHGFNHGGQTLLFIPEKENKSKFQLLNLSKLAKQFAEIKRCLTLIIFDGTLADISQYPNILKNYMPSEELYNIQPAAEQKQMPGYSTILYSVPKDDFNTPDVQGNTAAGNRLKYCFQNNKRTLEELLVTSQLSADMIDIFTSDQNDAAYKCLNLFHPLKIIDPQTIYYGLYEDTKESENINQEENEEPSFLQKLSDNLQLDKAKEEEKKNGQQQQITHNPRPEQPQPVLKPEGDQDQPRRETVSQRIKKSIKENRVNVEKELQLEQNRSSFNFILKEHRKGVIYMGSQIDTCIYIIYTNEQGEQTYKTIPLGTQPLCGILASDDEVLLIGGYNEMILYFSIAEENLLDPQLTRKAKFTQCVTCISALNDLHFLIGQEKGLIDILNIQFMQIKDPTFVLKTHADFVEKTHVFDFKRTGEKDIFAVATYKGLFMVMINPISYEIQQLRDFFNDNKPGICNELHAISYVDDSLLLLQFIKEAKLQLFNYKKGEVNCEIIVPKTDKFVHAIVSLEEVLREKPLHSQLSVSQTAVPSKVFIIQGSQGLQVIDLDRGNQAHILKVNECFKGILVEKMAGGEGVTIYTNKRDGIKRSYIKANLPF